MNPEENKLFIQCATISLRFKYTEEETKIIVDWFKSIKGAGENELIGHERVGSFLKFCCAEKHDGKFSVFDTLMSRIWIYAPYILEQHKV